MGRSGKSGKRILTESPPKRSGTPKRSRTVSSPSDPPSFSSYSHFTATVTTTTTKSTTDLKVMESSGPTVPPKSSATVSSHSDVSSSSSSGSDYSTAPATSTADSSKNTVSDSDSSLQESEKSKPIETEEHEELFYGEERDSYKLFCSEMILHPSSAHIIEDPSSPFTGEDDEVDGKFESFLSEFPGEEDDVAYLRFRQDANQITVALSKEDIRELNDSTPFWASAEHIDTYLHCRLKLFPSEIKERINQCNAYMISLNMKDLDDWKDRTPLSILEKALETEIKEVDFNILPLLYEEHWTLAIICGLGNQRDAHLPGVPFRLPCVLHFNSLIPKGIEKCHAYAIATAVAKKANIDSDQVAWHQIQCPQQKNGKDCGFYTMRFAVDFVKYINSPNYLAVHDFKKKGEITKVAKKARQQLKGFIGSIQPEERDWIDADEFLEGRPGPIDTLPYCIPDKILEDLGNEYKVKMHNSVRAEHVPCYYVMQHWRHIVDDYFEQLQR